MSENEFIQCIKDFKESKLNREIHKRRFKKEVILFMRNEGFPVEVNFFGETFGIDLCYSEYKHYYKYYDNNFPHNIPLDILTKFCDYFGCEYKYTNCGGNRYIFGFNGLDMGY